MCGRSHFVPTQHTPRFVDGRVRAPHANFVCPRVVQSDSDTTRATTSASRPGSEWVDEDVNGGIMLPQEGRGREVRDMKEWAT